MTEHELTKQIAKIAADVTGVSLSETDPLKESGLDSLALVALIAEIEERFGFAFTDSELDPEKLQTLADLVAVTGKHI